MKNKNKIIIAVLLNLMIFGGIGYLINYLVDKTNQSRGVMVVTEFVDNSPSIVSSVDFGSATLGTHSDGNKSNAGVPSTGVSASATNSTLTKGSAAGGGTVNMLSNSGAGAAGNHKDISPSASGSGGGGTLLAYGGSGSRSATLNTGAGASLSAPIASASMAVPFHNNTTNGTILIDPGTDPNEDERIPVGNGVWILLLLGGIYGGYKFLD